jgi:hypothetical protein
MLSDLATKTEASVDSFKNKLSNMVQTTNNEMEHKLTEYEKIMEAKVEQALENAVQEINETTDAAIKDIANQVQQTKTEFMQHNIKRSALFPNVDPALYNTKMPPRKNPYETHHQYHTAEGTNKHDMPQYTHTIDQDKQQQSDEEWGRFGPKGDEWYEPEQRPLPQLNAYKMVNQVKVPYTGRESSYTWYYTFRTAVQQYGVLLIPVEQFQKNKSLCPRKYYGTSIDPLRYRDMAIALYQLLNHIDTIPTEHTEVRNIIQRHASNADGYSALYEIMERIHPLLNPDAKLQAPLSINSTDIHDYYNQVDSYLLHNSLEEVYFTPR